MIKSGETIYTSWDFDLIEVDGKIAVWPNKMTVLVLPFVSDERGAPVSIGVADVKTPHVDGGVQRTAISGETLDEDPDILATAQQALAEQGYDASDPARWFFLGFVRGGTLTPQQYPCFACDITGIDKNADAESTVVVLPMKEALDTEDALIPALFMKMFRYMFGFSKDAPVDADSSNKSGKEDNGEEPDVLSDDLKTKLLSIDGVVSAEAKDGQITVGIKNESPTVKDSISKVLDGKKFDVVITPEIIPHEVSGADKDKK